MSAHATPVPMTARRAGPLRGEVRVPGDKSISHRVAHPRRADGGGDAGDRAPRGAGRARHGGGDAVLRGRGHAHRRRRLDRARRGRRRLRRAMPRDRLRELGHRRAADHGRDGDLADHGDLHRRREPREAADGAGDRPARAVRRAVLRARGRAAADDRRGRAGAGAGALPRPDAVGAGEVGGSPRRTERAGRDRGDRARSRRATTPSGCSRAFGATDLDRGDARGPRHPPDRPARASARRSSPCRAIRPPPPSRSARR